MLQHSGRVSVQLLKQEVVTDTKALVDATTTTDPNSALDGATP